MPVYTFTINILAALGMGVAIGLERQYRQHPAGLRTNALVCVGAAMFVAFERLSNDANGPTRMAPYVVSGIGFLGGGVILRDGMTVKGMSTAATLWCTAAVGVLAGAGFLGHAAVGTVTVLGSHIFLRPVSRKIDAMMKSSADVETFYRLRVVCEARQEDTIRALVARQVNELPRMVLHGISTQENPEGDRSTLIVDLYSHEREERAMQDLMSRVNSEPSVISVRWDTVHGSES